MPILVTCKCGKKFRAEEKHGGKQKPCPKCRQVLAIEGPRVSAYDVFVSYSSKDKSTCDALVATFESKGMRCWIAPRDILPGVNWGEAIIGGIEQCRAMVLVFSGHSNESQQVKREVERAVSKGIPVIPLRIEDVKLSRAMEYFISSQHWLDALTPPLENHLEELSRKVMRLLTDDGSAKPPPARSGSNPIPAAIPIGEWNPPGPDSFSPGHSSGQTGWPTAPMANEPSLLRATYLLPRAARQSWLSRIPIVWRWVAVGGAAALFVLFISSLLGPSSVGTIKIHIPGSFTDLTVKIDGETISASQLRSPLRLKAGEHRLEVAGKEIELEDTSFIVKSGENPTLQVTLNSKPQARPSIPSVAKTGDIEPAPSNKMAEQRQSVDAEQQTIRTPEEVRPDPKSVTEDAAQPAEKENWNWTDPTNIGGNVDTGEFESAMTFTPDELTMFFGRLSSATKNRDIWEARRPSPDAPFRPAKRLLANINTASDEGSPTLSADGLTLFFDSTRPGGAGGWDIWTAHRASLNEQFGAAKNLGLPINTAGKDSGPTVTGDGLTLLLQSDRPGKRGQVSIWMSSRTSDNATFSEPIVLGPNINAGGRDFDPAISSDGCALVFVSDRSGGMGGDDLWMSTRSSRDAAFGPAVNLGPKINTSADEYKPSLSVDGRTLYFGSQRGGEGELWYAKRQLPSSENTGAIVAKNDPPLSAKEAAPASEAKWTDLFNGQNLTGWTPVASNGAWSVKNGVLSSTPGDGWLATDRDYSDFELELEYKIPPNGNTGVFLRAPLSGDPSGAGLLEVQAIDDKAEPFQNEPDFKRTGAVWGLFGGKPRADASAGKWNKLSIRAVGGRITVLVNGTKVTEGNLADEPEAALKPDMKLPTGRIGLQRRGATGAEFRNIRIRELSANFGMPADLEAMQGVWTGVAEEFKGAVIPAADILQMQKTLTISNDRFVVERSFPDGTRSKLDGTIQLDPGSNPKRFDWSGITSFDGKPAKWIGLYELSGDKLRIVYEWQDQDSSRSRPTKFASSINTSITVITFERAAAKNEIEWTELFNGRDLTGWTIHKNDGEQPATPWATDGDRKVIVARAGGHSWLETERSYRDFDLSLEWRFPPGGTVGANGSGIVIRADGLNSLNFDPKGIEIDLRTTSNDQKTIGLGCLVTYDTPLQHSSGGAPLSGNGHLGTTAKPPEIVGSQWNSCEITCRGDRITLRMNGTQVNEAWGAPQRAGKICLRNQKTDIEFRNIRIREIQLAAQK